MLLIELGMTPNRNISVKGTPRFYCHQSLGPAFPGIVVCLLPSFTCYLLSMLLPLQLVINRWSSMKVPDDSYITQDLANEAAGFSTAIQDPDDECHSSSDNMVWKSSESSFLTGIESSVDPLEKLVHLETEAVDELLNLPLQSFSMWFRMHSPAPDFRDKHNGLASWSLQKGRVYASNRSRSVI